MFKDLLKNVESLEWIRDVSLILFFILFLMIVIWVFFLDKKFINYMSELPLEKDNKIKE